MLNYNRDSDVKPGNVITIKNQLEKPSPIFFGYDIEKRFTGYLDDLHSRDPFDRIFLFTDSKILNLFGKPLLQRIKEKYASSQLCLLPCGEKVKTFKNLEKACENLILWGVTKKSLLISLGGGSVGNIVGLAAGLLFRGIRFMEVPTTMSHQTDGILSNKQAVNGTLGKNHFGLYHAPVYTWIDTKYLETEPPKLKKAGIVEGIKNGFIDQPGFIPYLASQLKRECNYTPCELTDLCHKIIVSKNEILKKDPTEKKYGIILEYGHTFAHAIEWLAQGELLHGEAVSLGMKMSAHLSARLGYIDEEVVRLHYDLIDEKLGLTPRLPKTVTPESLFETMYMDNKRTEKEINYVLLKEKGRCVKGNGNFLVKADKEIVQALVHEFIDNKIAPLPPAALPGAKLSP